MKNIGIEHNKMNHVTRWMSFMPLEPKLMPNHPIGAVRWLQERKFQQKLNEIYKKYSKD